MAEELVFRTDKKPTLFNKDMVIGGLLAMIVASPILPVAGATPLIVGVSALVGGALGKLRMEQEQKHGRLVSDTPSFWNKDTFLGGLLGYIAGALIAIPIALSGLAALSAAEAPTLVSIGGALLGAVGSMFGGTALGAFIGGKRGQNIEKTEFEQAKQREMVLQEARSTGVEPEKTIAYTALVEQQRADAKAAELRRNI